MRSVEQREQAEKVRQLCASRAVRGWERHVSLVQLLQSSMADVERRWSAGSGPLADVLLPAQLSALTKALFQNNARRAALLQTINSSPPH